MHSKTLIPSKTLILSSAAQLISFQLRASHFDPWVEIFESKIPVAKSWSSGWCCSWSFTIELHLDSTNQKVFAGRERQRQRQRFLFCICGFSFSFDETWRIEEKGTAMREIVQVQVGNYANFVGAHFWNFQVQVFSLHVFFFVGHETVRGFLLLLLFC